MYDLGHCVTLNPYLASIALAFESVALEEEALSLL